MCPRSPKWKSWQGTGKPSRHVLGLALAIPEPINEQSDHAPGVLGSAIIGGPAQACYRIQKIPGSEIGTDLAGSGRRLEKHAKCRLESLLEIRRQGLEGLIPRVQSRGQPAFCSKKSRISPHPSRQGLARPVLGSEDRCGVCAGIDFATEDGSDQIGSLRKVSVKGPDADTRLLDDLSHRSVHSCGREHVDSRLEQRVDVALCVDAHWPVVLAPRLQTLPSVFKLFVHQFPLDNRNIVPYLVNTTGTMFRSN